MPRKYNQHEKEKGVWFTIVTHDEKCRATIKEVAKEFPFTHILTINQIKLLMIQIIIFIHILSFAVMVQDLSANWLISS